MDKKRYGFYSIGALLLIGLLGNQTFGEVTSMQVNDEMFYKGEQIKFSGTVEEGSTGLVTIVIRDVNNEFVLLTQAIINYNNTFEKNMSIENKFTEHGTYSATGFILNMTKGFTSEFDISLNQKSTVEVNEINEDKKQDVNQLIKKEQNNKNASIEKQTKVNFVDAEKEPSYYVERYYSEPTYKSWFDRNYPGLTIEEAVGYTEDMSQTTLQIQENTNNNLIPEAQASSLVEPIKKTEDNSEIAQVSLAIAGLGILFGAVYGVKRQVDNNSKQILVNRDTIRKKIIKPIIGSNPKEILQTRLVKGEISVEEYELLKSKLT